MKIVELLYKAMHHLKTVSTVLFFATAAECSADSFSENFNGANLNSGLYVETDENGFSFSLTNGQGVFSKQSGVGNGRISVLSNFEIIGDFTATIQCGRIDLAPSTEAGLALWLDSNPTQSVDIFFHADDYINANLFTSRGPFRNVVANTASTAMFQITRSGDTISLQYDVGSGFQTLESTTDASFDGPLTLRAFLCNEYGDTGAHSAWFDNLTISADELLFPTVPEPSTTALLALGLLVFFKRQQRS